MYFNSIYFWVIKMHKTKSLFLQSMISLHLCVKFHKYLLQYIKVLANISFSPRQHMFLSPNNNFTDFGIFGKTDMLINDCSTIEYYLHKKIKAATEIVMAQINKHCFTQNLLVHNTNKYFNITIEYSATS